MEEKAARGAGRRWRRCLDAAVVVAELRGVAAAAGFAVEEILAPAHPVFGSMLCEGSGWPGVRVCRDERKQK
jgi:hypothetical protein